MNNFVWVRKMNKATKKRFEFYLVGTETTVRVITSTTSTRPSTTTIPKYHGRRF